MARFADDSRRAIVQLITHDATAPVDPALSVHTPDLDAANAQAQALGDENVHPLTVEEWGGRFFVRARTARS